jgi:hypothetical protein
VGPRASLDAVAKRKFPATTGTRTPDHSAHNQRYMKTDGRLRRINQNDSVSFVLSVFCLTFLVVLYGFWRRLAG